MSKPEDNSDKHELPVEPAQAVPELAYALRDRRPSSVARDKARQDSRTRSFTSGRERPAFQLSHQDEEAIEENEEHDDRDHVRFAPQSYEGKPNNPLAPGQSLPPSFSNLTSLAQTPVTPGSPEDKGLLGSAVLPKKYWWRLAASMSAYGICGWSDGTAGAMIPSIEADYKLAYIKVSLIFVAQAIGFLIGTFSNEPLIRHVGLYPLPVQQSSTGNPSRSAASSWMQRLSDYRKSEKAHSMVRGRAITLVMAHTIQLVYFITNCSYPPFYGMVIAAICGGTGQAIATGQLNAYAASQPQKSGMLLGFLHGGYGLGALLSPLVATTVLAKGWIWYNFYFLSVGYGVANIIFVAIAFWPDAAERKADLSAARDRQEMEMRITQALNNQSLGAEALAEHDNASAAGHFEAGQGRSKKGREAKFGKTKPQSTMGKTLSLPFTWFLASFLFLYTGYEVTSGGWIVTYLLEVRHAEPTAAGYAATGFWAGLTAGRLCLGITSSFLHWSTEKHLVHCFLVFSLGMGFVVWFVKPVIAGAVATALIGFAQGPIFPIACGVSAKLLPPHLLMTSLSFVSSAASIGGAVWPFLCGALSSAKGVEVLMPLLVGIVTAMTILWTVIPSTTGVPDNLRFGVGSLPRKTKALLTRS